MSEQLVLGQPPRNVLTHLRRTITALAEIEGPEWLAAQKAAGDDRNLRAMVRRMKAAIAKGASQDPAYYTGYGIVYGGDRTNRWVVRTDGAIILSGLYDPTPETVAKARALGFPVAERSSKQWEPNSSGLSSSNALLGTSSPTTKKR